MKIAKIIKKQNREYLAGTPCIYYCKNLLKNMKIFHKWQYVYLNLCFSNKKIFLWQNKFSFMKSIFYVNNCINEPVFMKCFFIVILQKWQNLSLTNVENMLYVHIFIFIAHGTFLPHILWA